MHASIIRIKGDRDDLLPRHDATLTEVPADKMVLHLALRAPDGNVIIDTCPTRGVVESFVLGGTFQAMCERHGLRAPEPIEGLPVNLRIVDGVTVREGALR